MTLARLSFAALLFSAVAVAAAPAFSDEATIKYRQSIYKSIGGHMGALAAIVKGEVPFTDDVGAHAQGLADLAQIAGHVFPEGSDKGAETEALPVIWEKPDEFKKRVADFQAAAANLASVAKSEPKGVAPAVGALGKTCKACHDDFRKKK